MTPRITQTTAFFIQSAISFMVATLAVGVGIALMPVELWIRAFLGLGTLYIITSTFSLAKCIRDRQELVEQMPPALPPNQAGPWS
jgi:hypothetical protein